MKTTLALAALSFVIFLSSCNTPRFAYAPSAQNVPLLKKKGDSKLAALYSTNFGGGNTLTTSSSNGADLQGAIAITDHFAIQANYFYRHEITNSYAGDIKADSNLVKYKRNAYEIAIGYYKGLDKKGQGWFQVFAGIGPGKMNFTDWSIAGDSSLIQNHYKAGLTKFFIQAAFIYTAKRGFAFSLSGRGSFIHFHDVQTDYTSPSLDKFMLSYLKNKTAFFIEPAFNFSYSFKKLPAVRLEMQFGFCYKGGKETFYNINRKANFSIGAMVDVGKLVK